MLKPIPGAEALLAAVQNVLGPERLPLVIGIDGRWGAGKSGLASWLGWQLGMPAIHLDLYMIRDSEPLEWRNEDLTRVMEQRRRLGRPVIVEGICLCRALQTLDRDPDFLIWLENNGEPKPHGKEPTVGYFREFQPKENADYRLTWDSDASQ